MLGGVYKSSTHDQYSDTKKCSKTLLGARAAALISRKVAPLSQRMVKCVVGMSLLCLCLLKIDLADTIALEQA